MKKDIKILTLGGDGRFYAVADYFAAKGYDSRIYALPENLQHVSVYEKSLKEALRGASFLCLPIPYQKNGYLNAPLTKEKITADEIFSLIDEKTVIFCGRADERIKSLRNKVYDYSEREDFAILNAGLTAEAAVEIAIHELPISLREAKTAILGYGRIGKALATVLRGFGTNFTVYARRDEIFASLEANSYAYADIGKLLGLSRYDFVINTVPKLILFKEQLSEIKKNALLLELASAPGGIDKDAAETLGLRVIVAGGLPGKCSPLSAGRIIGECTERIIYSESL